MGHVSVCQVLWVDVRVGWSVTSLHIIGWNRRVARHGLTRSRLLYSQCLGRSNSPPPGSFLDIVQEGAGSLLYIGYKGAIALAVTIQQLQQQQLLYSRSSSSYYIAVAVTIQLQQQQLLYSRSSSSYYMHMCMCVYIVYVHMFVHRNR